jgi:hypothetical protein
MVGLGGYVACIGVEAAARPLLTARAADMSLSVSATLLRGGAGAGVTNNAGRPSVLVSRQA